MASIVRSIGDLIGSLFELVGSVIQTAFSLVKGVFEGAFKFVEALLSSVLDLFKGALHAAGGVGKFVAGNLGVLLIVIVAVFAFLQYQRSQGKTVKVGDKKLN